MTAIDDVQLLDDYVQTHSTAALGRLIERHIDFVFSAAVRQVRDEALAEDVTQAVFIIFATKAGSIRAASLAGWLFNTTRHCAANARRSELRRRRHERMAAKPEVPMHADDCSTIALDEALGRLGRNDREVVLLRYLQEREFAEVGSILGISEQTARQRLSRAIERLRKLMSASGQSIPAAMVVQTLSGSVLKAPAHLSGLTIAAAGGHAVTGGAVMGLAMRTAQIMGWVKFKIAATIVLTALVTGASGVVVVRSLRPQMATPIEQGESVSSPAANAEQAGGGTTVATFADGMRLEVIGVCSNPSAGKQWWRPDGSALARSPYPNSTGRVTGMPGWKSYEFAVQETGVRPEWSAELTAEENAGTVLGYPNPKLMSLVTALPGYSSCALQYLCATGPWQTRAVAPAGAVFSTGFMLKGIAFVPGKDAKQTSITIRGDHGSIYAISSGAREIVAVGFDGKEHGRGSTTINAGLLMETIDITFPGIRREQIKEFQVRTRPYNRTIEFKNISLGLGQIATPVVVQHDGGGFVGSFASGGSVEVVGIADWPATGNWWRPDGMPVVDEHPEASKKYFGREAGKGEHAYAVAVRWNNPGDSPSWFWQFPLARATGVPMDSMQMVPGAPDVYRIILADDKTAVDFRVGLACGAWRAGPVVAMTSAAAIVSINNTDVSFAAPVEKDGEIIIKATDHLGEGVERQLVAIEANGALHIADVIGSSGSGEGHTYRFSKMSRAGLKSYQMQTREYEFINFRRLSVIGGKSENPTIEGDLVQQVTPPGQEGL